MRFWIVNGSKNVFAIWRELKYGGVMSMFVMDEKMKEGIRIDSSFSIIRVRRPGSL